MASSSFWKLRRLAPRAQRVVERRKADSPAIAAYESNIKAKTQAFIAAYEEAARYEANWRREMQEGRDAVRVAVSTIRSWLPLVQRDIPGFVSSNFADVPDVPDDVIEDGSRLYDIVNDYVTPAKQPLPYQKACCDAIDTALKSATKEIAEAETADKKYQGLLAKVRETGSAFDTELQAFRRTFAAVNGRSDKDYQKLRSQRAQLPDVDDDAQAPAPPEPVAPAPAGPTTPTGTPVPA